MRDDTLRRRSEATVEFERALESVILEAFARGAAVEGTWEIEVPVPTAPNWRVEITKQYADETPDHESILFGE